MTPMKKNVLKKNPYTQKILNVPEPKSDHRHKPTIWVNGFASIILLIGCGYTSLEKKTGVSQIPKVIKYGIICKMSFFIIEKDKKKIDTERPKIVLYKITSGKKIYSTKWLNRKNRLVE